MGKKKSGSVERTDQAPFELAPSIAEIQGLMEAKDYNLLKKTGDVEGVAERLKCNLQTGLAADDDISKRRAYYGANEYPSPPTTSWLEFYLDAWGDLAVRILAVAAIVALAGGITETILEGDPTSWVDGVAIIVAVIIVTVAGATNNYMKEMQFQALRNKASASREQRVIRGGVDQKIPLNEVVVGDLIPIFAGDQVPADGIFVSGGEEVACDESAMTGEPDQKSKDRRHPFLLSGTYVTKGSGFLLVLQIGELSEWGQLLKNLQTDDEETPLQEKLEGVVVFIGKIGMVVAAATFIVLLGYWIADYGVEPYFKVEPCNNNASTYNSSLDRLNPNASEPSSYWCANGTTVYSHGELRLKVPTTSFQPSTLLYLLSAFIIGVTIVVVAVPEGLPLAVLISLAYSMQQMTKDQNLVRHLSACEIMGGATDICSDKTGTLTENRMAVVAGYIGGKQFDKVSDLKVPEAILPLFAQGLCCNINDGKLAKADPDNHESITSSKTLTAFKFVGSTTECALLVLAARLGEDYTVLQEKYPKVHRWNFSSARKRMSTVIKHPEKDGAYRLLVKGASEMVLQLCTHMVKKDGKVEKLKKDKAEKMGKEIESLATKGLRTIGIAYRDFDKKKDWNKGGDSGEGFEEKLTLIALVGIEDPLRAEVPEAVKTCQRAGITVRMVTGDNVLTAKKIAQDCGIFNPENGVALEGPNFNEMTDEQVLEVVDNLQVLARSKPNDKHRLVTLLKQRGHVVAVTGDGTNDGPALRAADVGLAMGIAGTEVAREAADIIILDDNFASIVKSVLWGRCVFDNIRKFIQFQLTVNVVALVIAFVSAISRRGTPLTAIQLLWVNLIMDTLAALALGTERPVPTLLNRKPYGRSGRLITWTMWRNILGQSFYQCLILFLIIYMIDAESNMHMIWPWVENGVDANNRGEASTHYTMVFNTFVFLQVFNEINSRKVGPNELNVFSGMFTNWLFYTIILFIILIQLLIAFFGGVVMKTNGLWTNYYGVGGYDWILWICSIGSAAFCLVWGFLLRLIPMKKEPWEKTIDEE